MSLFQKSILNKYLAEKLSVEQMKTAYQKFVDYFHNVEIQKNIREAKEEQFQEGFLRELFVNVLGYTINPNLNYNLTTEFKNLKDARKADGAIIDGENVKAIIELKDTKTINLKSIENQAFGYKNNQKNCRYVIISNFEKLRLYIDNAIDFEEWDLFKLSEADFKVLFLLLNKDHLLADVPAELKKDSLIEEENISKRFYQEYSTFRKALFQNLILCNPQVEKLLLFKKTQKLLDRFLFLFFAKDKGLVAPNAILNVLDSWKRNKYDPLFSIKQTLYDYFKRYFHYLNIGFKNEKFEIFAYNGGLFAPDEIIDNFKIADEILDQACNILSKYNYDSEVDVNILGHIFEHSLKEIEELETQLLEIEINQNQKVTKRKKDGIFYTPRYITKYIVENTLGVLCSQEKQRRDLKEEDYFFRAKSTKKNQKAKQENAQIQDLLDKLHDYKNWLLNLSIVDPACGSGAFLNQALTFLINEHKWLSELEAKLTGSSLVFDLENSILENNLFGVDINEESVEISKLSLWLRTAKPHRQLTSLNNNIKCGNSLVDDPNVAGEKAFNWQQAFPHIFEKGGFDVVIGNPPYVFVREKITQLVKDYYNAHYISAEYQLNTYILFMEKSIALLKNNGFYGLIVPNAWLMVSSGTNLRKHILETSSLKSIVNLEGYSFENVNVETLIVISTKKLDEQNTLSVFLNKNNEFVFSHKKEQKEFLLNSGYEFRVFSNDKNIKILNKIALNMPNLDELVTIKAGLQAYESGKGNPIQTPEDVKNRPYDFTYKVDDNTYKYLDGQDVNRYAIEWSGSYLKYGDNLAAPRTFDLFNSEKIIIREITGKYPKSIIATYEEEIYLFNRSNIVILKRENDISLKYILALLNSELMSFYFMLNTAKSNRKLFPKIILNDLRKFPIKKIAFLEQQPFIEKVNTMLTLNQTLLDLKTDFNEYLTVVLKVSKLSKILQNPEKQSLEQLTSELKKQKVNTDGFEIFKSIKGLHSKFIEIKNEIEITDQKINQMVYELYELTPEEIAIIESSN
jgi:hypothetical protein